MIKVLLGIAIILALVLLMAATILLVFIGSELYEIKKTLDDMNNKYFYNYNTYPFSYKRSYKDYTNPSN